MSDQLPDEGGFVRLISRTLAAKPEFLGAALSAISRGMDQALRRERSRSANSDLAALAAMALAKGGRISEDLRETLLARVVASLHPSNQNAIEREYSNAYDALIKERKA